MMVGARGKACPEPVVMAIKALSERAQDEALEVLVDHKAAVEDVKRIAKGYDVSSRQNGPKDCPVIIRGAAAASDKILTPVMRC